MICKWKNNNKKNEKNEDSGNYRRTVIGPKVDDSASTKQEWSRAFGYSNSMSASRFFAMS